GWGYNGFGQLGIASVRTELTPSVVGEPKEVVAVAAGRSHTCAVLPDGSVACWGDNAFGQLLAEPLSSPSPLAVSGVTSMKAISAGGRHTCALGADGSVTCWGWNANGQVGDGTVNALPPAVVKVEGVANAVQ